MAKLKKVWKGDGAPTAADLDAAYREAMKQAADALEGAANQPEGSGGRATEAATASAFLAYAREVRTYGTSLTAPPGGSTVL